ncbi:Fanconi anemia group D2 protein, partial [Armadillidium nasatum]
VIKENFDAVKILCDLLLRSNEVEVSRFGFKYAFASLGVFHQQEVILCLLSHLGDNECVRQSSLSLLSVLAYNYPGSLDILETLSLREAKILMDLLLLLVNSNQAESSKDELSIMIKKQLSHPDIKFKKLGVVGAVLTLKITMGTSNSDGEDSSDMETNLKESEVLFNAVKESTTNYPCSSALFMDELATNILKNGLNQRLEKWISEKVIGDFEETFILDCETEGQYDKYICPVSFQWNLDDFTDSEKSKSIAVCIAKLVTEDLEHSDLDHSSRIVTVAPHFRLMRMVESHLYAGDLGNIDALLGCGVQMPTPETYEEFSSLSDKEQTFALTCLFYAINWFRELINAFATQKDKELKRKVKCTL